MAILRKLVVPTLVTVAAVQYFRSSNPKPNNKQYLGSSSSSNPKPNIHEKNIQIVDIIDSFPQSVEIVDSFPHPGRGLANAFRTAGYSLIDLVNPWSPINLMANAMNWANVGGSGKWKLKQTAEALVLQLDVSGVAGEVKVSVKQNTDLEGPTNNTLVVEEHGAYRRSFFVSPEDQKFVTIFGHGTASTLVNHPAVLIIEHKGSEDSSSSRWLLDLPYNVYNNSAIKIEEKNKMLQVTIPKLKPMWIDQMHMRQQPI